MGFVQAYKKTIHFSALGFIANSYEMELVKLARIAIFSGNGSILQFSGWCGKSRDFGLKTSTRKKTAGSRFFIKIQEF
jgi:hypothetical protein